MQNPFYLIFVLTVLLSICMLACTADDEENAIRQQLEGRWEIVQAFRNEKPTTSLENLYFDFYAPDSLRTNLNNGRTEANYFELDDQTIVPVGSKLGASYTIQEVNDSTLILVSTINKLPFRFLLKRSLNLE